MSSMDPEMLIKRSLDQQISRDLLKKAMMGQWNEVVEIYKKEAWTHKEKITRSGETALHIAVSDGQKEIVKELIEVIKSQTDDQNHAKEAVSVENKQGNTALHLAASKKEPSMCKSIAEVNSSLVGCRNHEGETPFFLAAFHGKKRAFLCLHQICAKTNQVGYYYSARKDGNTTLHCAINGEHFDLAYQIIHLYPDLANWANKKGLYPLHILAAKPSAFRSGKPLGAIWHRAIYNRIVVDELKPELQPDLEDDIPNNHPRRELTGFVNPFSWKHMFACLVPKPRGTNGTGEGIHDDDELDHYTYPTTVIDINLSREYYSGTHHDHGGIFSRFFKFAYSKTMWIISWSMVITSWFLYIFTSQFMGMLLLPFGIKGYSRRRRMEHAIRSSYYVKQKHTWAVQIMNILLERTTDLYQAGFETWANVGEHGDRINDHESNERSRAEGVSLADQDRETPILTAAKYGVIEMVERILELYPIAIYDVTSVTNKNIVLLAVEKRQIHVYQLLLQKTIPRDSVFGHVDEDGNSALHLAANLPPNTPGMIPGLQMLWEIKWYQFVKDSMPPYFFPLHNKENKTPIEMFTKNHRKLVRSGGKWLSRTSNSSSVVATLIASVAFATATTIPGGLTQDCGTTMYGNQPAFSIFAISSLLAVFFSVASVVMFFTLISSHYEARDFSSNLPKKLLMSLMTLFIGITSLLISFCVAHFFLLQDKQNNEAWVLYAVVVASVIYLTIKNSSVFLNLMRVTFSDVPERLYEDDV
ncbi:hypothetical protein F2P56_034802 [Juglans regia]|uniref:Uncharacterized protein LOC109000680 n=2 Tax=Juglans regia TaxID=51240 RepID=A0A2I4FNI3_JUGRE|nr:uncharacterized protein LOC109000680 [Juglans regia]KAF5445777.1 hypothetical protein F2P56_034802 [Juglans regia]